MLREMWLSALADKLAPLFEDAGKPLPKKIRFSCGWPSAHTRSATKRHLGECWASEASGDGATEIFISPVLEDGYAVASVLAHELCHAAAGVKEGHKGGFRELALSIGLEGKMTETTAGADLKAYLKFALKEMSPYPHKQLDPDARGAEEAKKQTTRLIKLSCASCGYLIRSTRKWIEIGLPICHCGGEFCPEDVING